uniref:Reverse transcriptase domain-containing protein n=1 Tax=Fagus sylvatica TaxID=28930 RepID=A0A2N9GEX2_FAGSY
MGFAAAIWFRDVLLERNGRGGFVTVTVLGDSKGRGCVIVPEGRDTWGWRGLSKEVDGLMGSKGNGGTRQYSPGGQAQGSAEVNRTWGSTRDWFIELRDGRRLRIPVDLRAPHRAGFSTRRGCDYKKAFSIGYRRIGKIEIQEKGRMTLNGIWILALSRTVMVFPLSVIPEQELAMIGEPLAVVLPLGLEHSGNEAARSSGSAGRTPSEWVIRKQKGVGKVLGASYEGYEQIVTELLMDIEARYLQRKAGLVDSRRPSSSGRKGSRELKGLISSINYESRDSREAKGKVGGRCLGFWVWDELAGMRSWWEVPWVLGGDFNVVRFPSERGATLLGPITGRLIRLNSDHFPVLLECGVIRRGRRPFRFENMWLKVEGFGDRVKSWWESYSVTGTPSYVFANKLKALKADLKIWNDTEFGHISMQKQQLMAALREIDAVTDTRPLDVEEKGRRELTAIELDKVILMEEISWRQKSRALWLKEGDKNSRFFHRVANSHRNANTIGKLLINGIPSTNQDEIRDHISQFYEQLYKENGYRRPMLDGIQFTSISEEEAAWLDRPFEESEIVHVVQGCNGDKASGPDGFSLAFFPAMSLNATFISLIPKKHGADEIKDFRPISLVSGRILDSVLIANECLDSRLKANVPGVLCKLGLRRRPTIMLIGSFFCICFGDVGSRKNGGGGSIFAFPQCVSPSWSMALSRLIDKAIGAGMISGFSVSRDNHAPLLISHLLFADDTLIFCKSELVQVGEVPLLEELADILGCKTSTLPMKYLGLPLGASFKSKNIWNPIVEKMERRLAGWKRLYLSKAAVAKRIDKIQRNFLWGSSKEDVKFHLVKWDLICSPYVNGGLAIKNLRLFNEAFLGKWLWRYGGSHGVGLWKFIRAGWDTFSRFVKFKVGDGSRIRLWDDVWCIDVPLKEAFPGLYCLACIKDATVADSILFRGEDAHWEVNFTWTVQDWEIGTISSFLELLYSTTIKRNEEDRMCWRPSLTKGFHVKSYYKVLSSPRGGLFPWKSIWKVKVPPRVAFLLLDSCFGEDLNSG